MENIYSYIALAYFAIGFILTHRLVGLIIDVNEKEWKETLVQQLAIIFLWLPVSLWLLWHLVFIPILYLSIRNWEKVIYYLLLVLAMPLVVWGLASNFMPFVYTGIAIVLAALKVEIFSHPDAST